jgi:hypothetical protein
LTPAPDSAAWLVWLEHTGLGVAMRQWRWLYPIVEIVHIFGIVLLAGAAAMWDLRLLGVSRRLPVSLMERHLLPWARLGFATVLPTGLMMFVAHAGEMATNPAFQLKITLIVLAVANTVVFHRGVFRSVQRWDIARGTPVAAKLAAVASLTLWAGVIACGRLLAYF